MVSPQPYSGIAKGPVNTRTAARTASQTSLLFYGAHFLKDSLWSGNGTHGNEAAEGFSFSRMPRYGDAFQPQFRPASNSDLIVLFNFV
jgi:hypothetical protein